MASPATHIVVFRSLMRASLVAVLSSALLATGCASAPPRGPDPRVLDLVRADARLLEGCYDCLIEARDVYDRVSVEQGDPDVLQRRFEAQLLITLRRKELALDATTALADARRFGAALPEAFQAHRALSILEAVVEDDVGAPERDIVAFHRAHAGAADRLADDGAWLDASGLGEPVREYLSIALRCSYAAGPRADGPESGPVDIVAVDAPPLLMYRRAVCGDVQSAPSLEAVRALVDEFVEASYFLARVALGAVSREGPATAFQAAVEAHGRFPDSPAITYTLGVIRQTSRDCGRALPYYDRTLLLRAGHENAMLGRTICLSHLERHAEAVEQATALIATRINVRDALYWRSWNLHRLGALDRARQDIDAAKRMGVSVNVATLAGVIEYDQDDLDPAREDLETARRLSRGRACAALWYLGLVHNKRAAWPESAVEFDHAMDCYRQGRDENRRALGAMEANLDVDPEFREQELTRLRTAIGEAETQYRAAAINAAKAYAVSGKREEALRLAAVAAVDPGLGEEVRILHAFLDAADP